MSGGASGRRAHPSQWREHQMACGGASTEANGLHQPASELLLLGDLLVNNVRCTPVHHIVSGVENQRGSLVEAQHQLALELCKASCFESGGSPVAME